MADPFSQLYQALTSMFATQANAAPMPVAPAAPVAPPPPTPPGAGSTRTTQAASTFDGMNPPAVPTAEAANPQTPVPQGQVLARLSTPDAQQPGTIRNGSAGMGQGMVDAINLAKGKSKWGAVAAGLASGIKGQQDADSAAVKQLREMMALQWGLNKDMNAMAEARRRNDYTERYYNSLTAAKENPQAERGRVIDPSQRASNITLARQRHMATLVAQGVPQSEIPTRMEEFDRQFGFTQAQPQQGAEPDINPTREQQDDFSPTPGVMGRTFSRGWVQPKDAPANPAVGSGQPVQVAPGAPAGTPRIRPNNAAPQGNPALDRARDAIARGAPREQVIERLRQNGIDPTGL